MSLANHPNALSGGAGPGSGYVIGGVLYGLNGQTITGNSSGAWAIVANGTNQSITLTPSGTGKVITSGNLLVGTGAVDSGALLQIGTNTTTNAGGAIFGTDTNLNRVASGMLSLNSSGTLGKLVVGEVGPTAAAAVGLYIDFNRQVPNGIQAQGQIISLKTSNDNIVLFRGGVSEDTVIRAYTSQAIKFYGGATTLALTLDTSGNATFSGIAIHASYTVAGLPAAAAGNTYGIVFVSDANELAGTFIGTAPTGGGAVKRAVYSTGAAWLLL